jgi:blocked early in transport 1
MSKSVAYPAFCLYTTNPPPSRYSSLNRRTPATSTLFDSYPGNASSSRPSSSHTPDYRSSSPYTSTTNHTTPYTSNSTLPPPATHPGYRPATPNRKGQYSTSVLESLESQNDTTATTLLSQKVGQLKQLTIAIGDEIRDSSSLADSINTGFENTSVRLKGTMRRMLRMAERTGVGWRVWLGFFLCVWGLFVWVWLF